MRITRRQAETNKAKVVESAAALFRAKGFDHVNIADLMQAAGLTHGGFYNHFDSKDELEAEACAHIFEKSVGAVAAIADLEDSARRAEAFDAYRRSYLSARARDAEAARCPMVAFAGDVGRQPEVVREEYAAGLRRYLDAFARATGEGRSRAAAIAQFAALTGALTLARSVAAADPALSDEILAAAAAALEPAVR